MSSVSPSSPQFQDRLLSEPSRLCSPLASLCLRLYDTRSRSVNPSCEVTKLIELYGERPSSAYRSEEPASRVASVRIPSLVDARQKSRTVSRYWSFHSTHGGGNSPTR